MEVTSNTPEWNHKGAEPVGRPLVAHSKALEEEQILLTCVN